MLYIQYYDSVSNLHKIYQTISYMTSYFHTVPVTIVYTTTCTWAECRGSESHLRLLIFIFSFASGVCLSVFLSFFLPSQVLSCTSTLYMYMYMYFHHSLHGLLMLYTCIQYYNSVSNLHRIYQTISCMTCYLHTCDYSMF